MKKIKITLTALLTFASLSTFAQTSTEAVSCQRVKITDKRNSPFAKNIQLSYLGENLDGRDVFEIKSRKIVSRITFQRSTEKGDLYYGTYSNPKIYLNQSEEGISIDIEKNHGTPLYGSFKVYTTYHCD